MSALAHVKYHGYQCFEALVPERIEMQRLCNESDLRPLPTIALDPRESTCSVSFVRMLTQTLHKRLVVVMSKYLIS